MLFKFIKTVGCLIVVIFIVFLIVALIFGGSKIKEIGDKLTGFVKEAFRYAEDKAEEIHKFVVKKIEDFLKPFKPDEKRDLKNK
jgi:Sec-independent protein translocase protein TatA